MMSLWEPFGVSTQDLGRFQRDVERSLAGLRSNGRNAFSPAVDVVEDKEAMVVRAELPGLKREEVDVSIDGNVLTLRGERKFEREEEGKRYHHVERSYGSFVRCFQLPTTVDAEKIDAKLADGVLTLRIPKKDVVKARKISVSG
jgi:HSP20 family protein